MKSSDKVTMSATLKLKYVTRYDVYLTIICIGVKIVKTA